jgi:hypothetical protein
MTDKTKKKQKVKGRYKHFPQLAWDDIEILERILIRFADEEKYRSEKCYYPFHKQDKIHSVLELEPLAKDDFNTLRIIVQTTNGKFYSVKMPKAHYEMLMRGAVQAFWDKAQRLFRLTIQDKVCPNCTHENCSSCAVEPSGYKFGDPPEEEQ